MKEHFPSLGDPLPDTCLVLWARGRWFLSAAGRKGRWCWRRWTHFTCSLPALVWRWAGSRWTCVAGRKSRCCRRPWNPFHPIIDPVSPKLSHIQKLPLYKMLSWSHQGWFSLHDALLNWTKISNSIHLSLHLLKDRHLPNTAISEIIAPFAILCKVRKPPKLSLLTLICKEKVKVAWYQNLDFNSNWSLDCKNLIWSNCRIYLLSLHYVLMVEMKW